MEYEGFLVLKAKANLLKLKSFERKADSVSDSDQGEEDSLETDKEGLNEFIKLEAEEFQVINDEKLEFIGVSGQPVDRFHNASNENLSSELAKEEKFIRAVFPEFYRKTKLQLIDEIRLLRDKNKVYKDTIDKFLDN